MELTIGLREARNRSLRLGRTAEGNHGAVMSIEHARRAWLRAVNVHLRAARSHETAAGLFAGLPDLEMAARESELAAAERRAYSAALARHPEWAQDAYVEPDAQAS
jgi:hypothetical protein